MAERPMIMGDERRAKSVLRQSLIVLAALLITLVTIIVGLQAWARVAYWDLDPTGLVIEHHFFPRYHSPFETLRPSSEPLYLLHLIFVGVLVSSATLVFALFHLDQGRRARGQAPLRMACMVAPMIAVLVLGLATAMLSYRWDQDTLARIHELVSPVELDYRMSCVGDMEPCSLLLAFDTVWGLVAKLLVVVAGLLAIPSVVAAYRAGRRGHRLGRRASAATLGCFVLGVLAMVATQAHRDDRAQELERCDAGRPSWTEYVATFDHSPPELQGVEVAGCDLELERWLDWRSESGIKLEELHSLSEFGVVGRIEGHADSSLLIAELSAELESSFGGAANSDPDLAWMTALYIDERTPPWMLAETFVALREVGLDGVVLMASTTYSGEFATLGPFRRPHLCRVGYLRWSDDGLPLVEFEDSRALVEFASAEGQAGLRVDF